MSRNGKNGRLDVRKTYKMLIGGAFVRSESGRALDVEAPGGRWLGHVCRASRKDFRNAVVAARKAAWAEASVVTVAGKIFAGWEISGGVFKLRVELPEKIGGTARLPDGTEAVIPPGGGAFSCAMKADKR